MSSRADRGSEAGLKELVAQVLADNAPMLKVFEHSGLATAEKHEGPVVHVTPALRLRSVAGRRCALTSRT